MATPEQPSRESARYEKPDRPLLLRLYSCPHLVALVRLFGYGELPSDEAKQGMQPLVEEFGRQRMEAAAAEVLDSRSSGQSVLFRLSDEVRQWAVQILGPQTEQERPSPGTSPSGPSVSIAAKPDAPHAVRVAPAPTQTAATASPSAAPPPVLKSTAQEPPPSRHPHPTGEVAANAVETADAPQEGTENFETFLVHFWLTGSEELCEYCMGLVEQVREDVPLCPEVTEQGWSLEAATVHYVATDLRAFVEQEAMASRTDQMHADHTRQMLGRVDWRELAESFLSDE